jgi:hypothetical protein
MIMNYGHKAKSKIYATKEDILIYGGKNDFFLKSPYFFPPKNDLEHKKEKKIAFRRSKKRRA